MYQTRLYLSDFTGNGELTVSFNSVEGPSLLILPINKITFSGAKTGQYFF